MYTICTSAVQTKPRPFRYDAHRARTTAPTSQACIPLLSNLMATHSLAPRRATNDEQQTGGKKLFKYNNAGVIVVRTPLHSLSTHFARCMMHRKRRSLRCLMSDVYVSVESWAFMRAGFGFVWAGYTTKHNPPWIADC